MKNVREILNQCNFFKSARLIEKYDFITTDFIMINEENVKKETFGISNINPNTKIFNYRKIKADINAEKQIEWNIKDDQINAIILHTTSLPSISYSVQKYHELGVSAHFIVDENGMVYMLVPMELCSYHAGESHFGHYNSIGVDEYGYSNQDSLNPISIGIEFLTPNKGMFTIEQIKMYKILCDIISEEYGSIKSIICHSSIALNRKEDPSCRAIYSLKDIKNELKQISFMSKRLDVYEDNQIVSFFKNPELYSILELEEIASSLIKAGYKLYFYENKSDYINNVINGIYDYIKCIHIELIFESEILDFNINKIKNNKIIQYLKKYWLENKSYLYDLSELKEEFYNSIIILEIVNSQKFLDIIKDVDLQFDITECIKNLQNERLIPNQISKIFIED